MSRSAGDKNNGSSKKIRTDTARASAISDFCLQNGPLDNINNVYSSPEKGVTFSDENPPTPRVTYTASSHNEQSATDYPAVSTGDQVSATATSPTTSENGHVETQDKSNDYTSFSELLRELGQEAKMVMLQYSQTFGDSEAYEQQACQTFVDLKAHALLLDQDINEKKKILHARLKDILKVLSVNKDEIDSN